MPNNEPAPARVQARVRKWVKVSRSVASAKVPAIAALLVGSITACFGQPAAASDQTHSEPATVRVDHLFAQWDKPGSPGCSVGISRAGELLYEHGYGTANVELQVPITPATVFHAASIAKVFTAMSVMLLAERGKLSLDDDVQKYLPEFPEYRSRITIRHLLSHTGGVRDVFELQALAAPAPGTRDPNDQFVNLLAHQRELNFTPGSEWQYSNGGYLLLATIMKRVTGQSLREFAAANIFGPLEMKDTRFHDDATEVIPNRASGYSLGEDGIRVATEADPGGIVGNAGLFTTARDLLRWADNWDQVRVGNRTMLDAMATPTTLLDGTRVKYGLGVELGEYLGTHTVGHSGGNSGFVARVVRYQEQKLAVAVLCNRDDVYNVGELADEVAGIYLSNVHASSDEPQASAPSPPIQLTAEDLARKQGLYQNPKNQQLLRVSLGNYGRLIASIVGRSNAWELTPVTPSQFTFLGGLVSLEFMSDARPQTQEIRVTDNETPSPFLIHRVAPWVPPSADLSAFEGNYRSAELGTVYTVVAKDADLKIRIPGRDEISVQPVTADTFAGDLVGVMKFSRDGHKRVSGFTVNTTGVRGLLFNRSDTGPCDAAR